MPLQILHWIEWEENSKLKMLKAIRPGYTQKDWETQCEKSFKNPGGHTENPQQPYNKGYLKRERKIEENTVFE